MCRLCIRITPDTVEISTNQLISTTPLENKSPTYINDEMWITDYAHNETPLKRMICGPTHTCAYTNPTVAGLNRCSCALWPNQNTTLAPSLYIEQNKIILSTSISVSGMQTSVMCCPLWFSLHQMLAAVASNPRSSLPRCQRNSRSRGDQSAIWVCPPTMSSSPRRN